jgi:putative hydrolase of the HAD superfamily
VPTPEAVFFDVDFTLIHPGPRFQGTGYFESCARHGIAVDQSRFEEAVAGAACVLDGRDELYDDQLFVRYTARIIELMGGCSPAVEMVARELYEAWAEHQHFHLYDDARETLVELASRGLKLGLISNSHRCLVSFQAHFGLDGLVSAAVSSSELGYLKPHPRIFQAALDRLGVEAARAVMVGDSVPHDIAGARAIGMRGVLLARNGRAEVADDVPVIASLRELPRLLG